MSQFLICPQGHSWDPGEGLTPSPGRHIVCPICGADPESITPSFLRNLPDHDAATLTQAARRRDTVPDEFPTVRGYEILGVLGRGGMGVVYKARQLSLKRIVALKMILAGAHAGSQELARFRTEAEAAAQLQHPNIVQIHEVGEQDRRPFFCLEFVDGPSLAQKLNGTPQPPRQAAHLIETLARAIHYAHQRGVVHRDLKPGNILLQARNAERGARNDSASASSSLRAPSSEFLVPKITDFGLAKRVEGDSGMTQTGTILGTPSYMAPEQAGARLKEIGPPADVYALGAILYEMLAGRPPFRGQNPLDTLMLVKTEEPVPPSRLQPKLPRDLETICLKCLHKVPSKRYASAEALADDLQRFLGDRPILARRTGTAERLWRWCRRNPAEAIMAASMVFLLVVIAVGASVAAIWLNEERKTALGNLDRAEKAEANLRTERNVAVENLWGAYLAQARAGRWSGQAGRRFDSLDALTKAAEIRPSLELRNEAIACMALVDLRVARQWEVDSALTMQLAFDAELKRYARGDRKGTISIRRVDSDEEVARLKGPGQRVLVLDFSPDGRFLAAGYEGGLFQLWDLNRREAVLEVPRGFQHYAVAFSTDSRTFATGRPDGSVVLYDLPSCTEVKRLPAGVAPHSLAFHPDGKHLAASSVQSRMVQVHDVSAGKVVTTLPHPAEVRGLAWRSDGKLLATAAANSHVYVWDMTGAMPQAPVADLQGHQNVATLVAFSYAGDILASTSWDGTTRLWDPLTGQPLLTCSGEAARFSPDDRFLAFKSYSRPGLWEVARGLEYRRLPAKLGAISGFRSADIRKDGRLLASAHDGGVALWDLAAGQEIAFLPVPKTFSALFHPDGKSLITSGVTGVHRWPIGPDEMTENSLRIGPPERLPVPPGSAIESASMTPDGRKLAVRAGFNRALVMDLEKPGESISLDGHPNLFSVAISPDGKWVATGTWHGSGVKVWDVETRKPIQELPAVGSATVAFSPDGRWLVASTGEEYRIYEVPTWKLTQQIDRDRAGDMPGPIAFTRDGKTLAIGLSRYVMQLLDPATGKQFATLETPTLQHLGPGCFSPDGGLLIPAIEARGIRVWDLGLIRRQLAKMKLDWEPPLELLPAGRPASVEAVKMRVVMGK